MVSLYKKESSDFVNSSGEVRDRRVSGVTASVEKAGKDVQERREARKKCIS